MLSVCIFTVKVRVRIDQEVILNCACQVKSLSVVSASNSLCVCVDVVLPGLIVDQQAGYPVTKSPEKSLISSDHDVPGSSNNSKKPSVNM